ncbi:MAG TPA: response regulator [Candidatus Angelobacter sp.]|jgi:PAS domain S-box-containing protein|nr:response regulator [Candidatus Angelobacter sp.]
MKLLTPSRKQVTAVVAFLIIARIAGFVVLGETRTGSLYSHFFEVAANLLAIGSSVIASMRSRGVYRIFWLLFGSAFMLQLVADAGWTYYIYFNIKAPEAALFPSLFYRLYAVPMAISLFLSEDVRTSKLETFLDGCIAIGLVGLCMYQVQMAETKAHDPNIGRLITASTLVNGLLLLAAIARFAFSTPGRLHRLFGRLAAYLSVYSFIAFSTSYVDAYFPRIDDAYDLIWVVTYLTAAVLAIRWQPSAADDKPAKPRITKRAALLCFNIAMATMVLGSAVLGFKTVEASRTVGLIAVGLVLFSYAIRCALMQDAQEKYVAALKEGNTRYECVSLATNDVLWDRNLADESVTWNNNVCSLFGYQPSDVQGCRDWWIKNIHPEDREEILSSVQSVLESEKTSWSGDYRFRRMDGSYAFVFDRSYVIRDANGRPLRMIGSIQDLSVRKQAELEIERARRAAESAAEAKSDFLSNMSHEIRTPLNGIMGMLELTWQTKLSPEQEELLTIAEESAEALLSVVNDVLDFSKIEAGKTELEQTEFDLSDTVAEAARMILVRAHQKKLDLNYHMAADIPYRMVGDPARLKQVLVNLLGNAVKFTEKGKIVLLVETDTSSPDEVGLRFSVSDTGIGIPSAKQKTIFQAFSQADSSITRRFGGTGLGLAISANIVELMKGRIWVESEVGQGSTFFFTARFGVSSSTNAVIPADLQSNVRGLRALIVDPTSRAFLQDSLDSWGFEVVVVPAAAEALYALEHDNQGYNLLLCDNDLPDMDGFALVERIQQSSTPLPATVLMLTSENYQDSVARCHELGIAAHLIKPFKRSELLSAVQRTLPGHYAHAVGDDKIKSSVTMESDAARCLNVLLAEDNLVNQKVAVRILQKMGHHVEVVENGRQALEKVKSQPIDLILMDGHMPEMDGLAATRAIREWERLHGTHVPIIAMTAMAMEGDRDACLNAGMDAFVPKPITIVGLQDTIQQVMDASAHVLSP